MAFSDLFTFRNCAIVLIAVLACALLSFKAYRYLKSRRTAPTKQNSTQNFKNQGPTLKALINYYNKFSGTRLERMREALKKLAPDAKIPHGASGFSGLIETIAKKHGLRESILKATKPVKIQATSELSEAKPATQDPSSKKISEQKLSAA